MHDAERTPSHALLAGLLLMLAACSTPPPTLTAGEQTQLCSRETPLGTSIPALKCRTREQAERDRAEVGALAEELRGKSAVSTEFGGKP